MFDLEETVLALLLGKSGRLGKDTYQCSEVGYLERRIVAGDTGNLIFPTIDLES